MIEGEMENEEEVEYGKKRKEEKIGILGKKMRCREEIQVQRKRKEGKNKKIKKEEKTGKQKERI